MDKAMRNKKIQMMLFYIFFKFSKLTDFWKHTPILHEYLESTFYIYSLGIILDSSGLEAFASSFFLPHPTPSKCAFLMQTLSLQRTNQLFFQANISYWKVINTNYLLKKHETFMFLANCSGCYFW